MAKNILFYFSGTGNSLKVARDLAKEMGDTDIVSIPKAINRDLNLSAERIGIIYPVYFFGMPIIVEEFVKKINPPPGAYIFAVVTGGGISAGTLGQNKKLLESKGLKLSAGFFIRMPGNYTPLYEPPSQEKQTRLFEKEIQKISRIAAIVKERRTARIENNSFLVNLIFSDGLHKSVYPKIRSLDKDFWADQNCNSCGVCVKVCPVKNIKLEDKKPVWLHRCEQCFACLHWCPTHAIQYGKKTAGRKRYRNLEIKLDDLI